MTTQSGKADTAQGVIAALIDALEEVHMWASTERRWAETPDLQTWINRCDKIEAAIALATKEPAQ